MRHFSRRNFAKLIAAPLTASIVQIAKSDESEAQSSPDVQQDKSKTGPLHPAILPNYVKPNQLFLKTNREQALGEAVVFVQLVSLDSNNTAYIRYRILDGDGNMGRWHDKNHKTGENKDSTLLSTTFLFSNDITVTPLSGEVLITGCDANLNGKIRTWVSTALNNPYADDDVTWNEQP